VVCIVWGTTYLAIRVAVSTIPPLLLTGCRFTVAGSLLLVLARIRGEALPRSRRVIADLFFVGFLMVGIGNLSVVWAERWVPSGMAALFVATAPFWAAVMERMRRDGDRIDRRRAVGILLGFAGVALLVVPGGGGRAFDLHLLAGALAIQAGAVAWQYGTMRGKYNLAEVPPLMSSAIQMLTGGVLVTLIGVVLGEPRHMVITRAGIAALAYLTLFGSVLAYTAYVYALKHMRVTNMSVYAYVNPLIAVVVGWIVLRERLTPLSVAGMGIILGGVALVQSGARRSHGTVEFPDGEPAEQSAA